MDVKTLPPIKNARGEVKFIVKRITNIKANKGLTFDAINDIYKGLYKKYNPKDLLITGMFMDGGFTTLKARIYTGKDLKYVDDEYLGSVPKEIRDKFYGKYYQIDVTISV